MDLVTLHALKSLVGTFHRSAIQAKLNRENLKAQFLALMNSVDDRESFDLSPSERSKTQEPTQLGNERIEC